MVPRSVYGVCGHGLEKPCGRSHLRWNCLWGHATCEECAGMVWRRCAQPVGPSVERPSGATERVMGVPQAQPLGPQVELPMGQRSV
eukprot:755440-Pyramimonas_sp.AAC.1